MTARLVQEPNNFVDRGRRGAIIGTCITAAVLAVAAAGIWRSDRGDDTGKTGVSPVEPPATASIAVTPPLITLFIVGSEKEAAALLAHYAILLDAGGDPVSPDQVLVVQTYEDAVRAQRAIEDARARLGSVVQVIDRRPVASESGGPGHDAGAGPAFTP